MKTIAALICAACLAAGCAATNANNPHEDAAVSPPQDAGPALCRDGSTPPCNTRS